MAGKNPTPGDIDYYPFITKTGKYDPKNKSMSVDQNKSGLAKSLNDDKIKQAEDEAKRKQKDLGSGLGGIWNAFKKLK